VALPYEHPLWRSVMGESLHPGGEGLSRRLVGLCSSFIEGDRVLDAGCGPGFTLGLLRETGLDAVGLDLSSHFLKEAASKGPVVRGQLQFLPFHDKSLDGVIAECVLSQQDNPGEVVAEFARVLKERGLLAVTDLFDREIGGSRKGAKGCGRGAVDLAGIEKIFTEEGFRIITFEDHSDLLRECAARLVWAGVLKGGEASCRCMGYGLWLAKKEQEQDSR